MWGGDAGSFWFPTVIDKSSLGLTCLCAQQEELSLATMLRAFPGDPLFAGIMGSAALSPKHLGALGSIASPKSAITKHSRCSSSCPERNSG